MGEESKISWTDATFNPWRGCSKVSPECDRCYAETMSGRNPSVLGIWGADGTRVVAAESYWRSPLKWNETAAREGKRTRVFCASLADVFEEWPGRMMGTDGNELCVCHGCGKWVTTFGDCGGDKGTLCDRAPKPMTMNDVRGRLFKLIDATPNLDWMLLTKRPANIRRMWPQYGPPLAGDVRTLGLPLVRRNVWLGTTAGLQETADRNVPKLLECADLSPVLWVSCEPMLGPVDFIPWLWPEQFVRCRDGNVIDRGRTWNPTLSWIITGGESGHNARPCHPQWVRNVRDQCRAAGVAFHHKQWGEWRQCDPPSEWVESDPRDFKFVEQHGTHFVWLGKKGAGRNLDGKVWDEFPAARA